MPGKKVVALTGAGISAESGIPTFRDAGGLWEGYEITDVASPEGWSKNPEMVLDFYNQRRKTALKVMPNPGHKFLADLEEYFDIVIVTQNIDDLHEKAGSSKVIHLHGNLFQSRSTLDPDLIYEIQGWELNIGDKCEKGSQLRPNIVWFGEMVPAMDLAIQETLSAEIFIIVGTSLVVYPAAGLLEYVGDPIPKFIIDPNLPEIPNKPNLNLINEKGSVGMKLVYEELVSNYR